MLKFIGLESSLVFEVITDMVHFREQFASFFIRKEGKDAKELKDKLLMVMMFRMMSDGVKEYKHDPDPLSLEKSYGITPAEIRNLWFEWEAVRSIKRIEYKSG